MHRHQIHLLQLLLVSLLLHWATTHSKYFHIHSHHHLISLELRSLKSLRTTLVIGNQCHSGMSHYPLVLVWPLWCKAEIIFLRRTQPPSHRHLGITLEKADAGAQLFWHSSLIRSALRSQGKRDWKGGKWCCKSRGWEYFWTIKPNSAGQRSPAHHDICLVSGSASCIPSITTHCGPEPLCWKEATPLPSLLPEKLAKTLQRHHAAVM